MLSDFTDAADGQIGKDERTITCPDQARDLQPQIFQHAAYFAVFSFGQDHFNPDIGAGAAFQIGVDRSVPDALYFDTLDQIFKLSLRNRAIGARAIGTFYPGCGQFQLPLQFAIGRQQQQSFGIQIEPSHRHQPRQVLGQPVINGWPPIGVALCYQHPAGFVIQEQAGRGGRLDRIAIDGHALQRPKNCRGGIDRLPVDRDAPFGDHPFNFAARGNPRTREKFGNTLTIGIA